MDESTLVFFQEHVTTCFSQDQVLLQRYLQDYSEKHSIQVEECLLECTLHLSIWYILLEELLGTVLPLKEFTVDYGYVIEMQEIIRKQ